MLVDWERVRDLRDEIGEDGFNDVVALFLEESDTVIDRITTGGTASDAELHFLRGAALNLGFADLADICRNGANLSTVARLYADSKAAFMAET